MKQKMAMASVVLASLTAGVLTSFAAGDENVSMYELGPVVVTANRVAQPILEARADISVVPRQEIEQMHMGSVEEILRTVPGVQFLNYGPNGLNANLSGIRINGSKDVVILVDGVRMTDFQGANNSGYMYASALSNIDSIERVEVLRGSAATAYGSTAKGGVINIITRNVTDSRSVIDVSRGSFDKENYRFNTLGKKGKLTYNIYYDKSLSGNQKDGSGKEWNSQMSSKSAGAKFTYDFNGRSKLSINYDEVKSDYRGEDLIYETPYTGAYESQNLTLKHDWAISDLWSNTLTYRHSKVKTSYSQAVDLENAIKTNYSYDFVTEQMRYKSSRHDIVFGVDYSKAHDNRLGRAGEWDETGAAILTHRYMKNYSYYIQDDWEIIPEITLSGGIRYDKPELGPGSAMADLDSHTSKSYKLSWEATDKDTFYAGRSDFYILPGLDQLYMKKWGNEKLKPAYGRTSNIGYSREFSNGHLFTLNWFKTEDERSIGYDADGQYQNYSDGLARGWNAQYLVQLGENWNARLGWAHLYQYAKGDNYALGYYPKDMATFGIYYNKDKVSAGLDGFYFIRRVNPQNSDKKGWPANKYGVYNLSVNYSPNKNTTLYAKVENIFNKLWAEHTDVIWQGKPGSWYSMPGRSFLMGMQLRF